MSPNLFATKCRPAGSAQLAFGASHQGPSPSVQQAVQAVVESLDSFQRAQGSRQTQQSGIRLVGRWVGLGFRLIGQGLASGVRRCFQGA